MDAGLECLGVHDYSFEVFNTDANVELFLDSEIFEVQCVNGNGRL